jgi:hypothetical protein
MSVTLKLTDEQVAEVTHAETDAHALHALLAGADDRDRLPDRSHGGREGNGRRGRLRGYVSASAAQSRYTCEQLQRAAIHVRVGGRTGRSTAHGNVRGLERKLNASITQARHSLNSASGGDAASWASLASQMSAQCTALAWAIYCLKEWPEPSDDTRDEPVHAHRKRLGIHSGTGGRQYPPASQNGSFNHWLIRMPSSYPSPIPMRPSSPRV